MLTVSLRERDKAHSERVRSLEIVMNEKEKQLLQNSNSMRQQLAAAKLESQQYQKQLETLETKRRRVETGNLEQVRLTAITIYLISQFVYLMLIN